MIDLTRRFLYGLKRLRDELFNKEDYWHLRLAPSDNFGKVYYLKMKKKGYYPGSFKEGIPVYYLNGKYPVFFHITTLNYALGLLERFYDGEDVRKDILIIFDWLIENQHDDGSWRYEFPLESKHVLSDNKPSGMTQGLAVSFILRVMQGGFVPYENKYDVILKKATSFMLSNCIVDKHYHVELIEEFYNPGDGILNGYIFALLGLYDYSKYISNFTYFNKHINNLITILPKYNFLTWTKYDSKGTISSRFYHQLHIDMMHVLYKITRDSIFLKYKNIWEIGMNLYPLFVLIKSYQKTRRINKMIMSYSEEKK